MDIADATADGDAGKVVAGILVAAAVSFAVSWVILMPRASMMAMMRMR